MPRWKIHLMTSLTLLGLLIALGLVGGIVLALAAFVSTLEDPMMVMSVFASIIGVGGFIAIVYSNVYYHYKEKYSRTYITLERIRARHGK